MEDEIRHLVQAIHDTPGRTVLVTAGAGTQALAWLLSVAGASRTLLEALVPYDWAAFDDFLGQTPAQYVAAETARLMAGRSLTRGRWLHQNEDVVGLACTATIATDRPKKGEHRAHLATWQPGRVSGYTLHLEKGARNRQGEEETVSRLMLNALAAAYGLNLRLDLALGAGDRCQEEHFDLGHSARRLRHERITHFAVDETGTVQEENSTASVILSGSFHPLHEGHLDLARAAHKRVQQKVAFELSARNVDKPALTVDALLDRMAQFAGRWPVVASNAPTFVEKSRLFRGATFVVGYDTAERIVQPRYYEDSVEQMKAALAEIRQRGCRFLVAGRSDEAGNFHRASSLDVPVGFEDLFDSLSDFRRDISSTELRRSGRRGSR